MNAVPIAVKKMIIPDVQTIGIFLGELKYNPRPICIYMHTKNKEAPFICKNRIIHPLSISRIMWITESKAILVAAT